jgi:predicted transcriptional regulator
MENRVYITQNDEIPFVTKALNSELRMRMLKLLAGRSLNVGQIAELLDIPQSTCTNNIKILEQARLIKTEKVAASKGVQKNCTLACDEIVIPLLDLTHPLKENSIETEMPIGLYTDFQVSPPCGLVTASEVLGFYDNIDSFFEPRRASAALIWLSNGYLEYRFPKNIIENRKIRALTVSCELCSEFPGFNPDWPSDITLSINGIEIGAWTAPGDMGGSRGRFTPSWWSLRDTQFGFLKAWKVTEEGSYIDGLKLSGVTLEELRVEDHPSITLRFAVKEDAKNKGGFNIFGKGFGNYDQDILMRLEIDEGESLSRM